MQENDRIVLEAKQSIPLASFQLRPLFLANQCYGSQPSLIYYEYSWEGSMHEKSIK